jgi:hypothetical protein
MDPQSKQLVTNVETEVSKVVVRANNISVKNVNEFNCRNGY